MTEQKYCPGCGQSVGTEQSLEGNYLLTCCAICGLGLGVQLASVEMIRRFRGEAESAEPPPALARVGVVKQARHVSPAVERPAPADARSASWSDAPVATPGPAMSGESSGWASAEAAMSLSGEGRSASGERPGLKQLRRVMVVEDSNFLREVSRDLLVDKQIAREVIDCEDGSAFLEAYTRMITEGRKPDLVVLDVRMPGIDGREAAYAMRAVESGLGAKPTPILFFSAVLCDAEFKATLAELRNARYIRKSDEDPNTLGERIVSVLERLIEAKSSG